MLSNVFRVLSGVGTHRYSGHSRHSSLGMMDLHYTPRRLGALSASTHNNSKNTGLEPDLSVCSASRYTSVQLVCSSNRLDT